MQFTNCRNFTTENPDERNIVCVQFIEQIFMKVRSSLKNLKTRDRNNKLVKRKGKLYIINKMNPRMKARQG